MASSGNICIWNTLTKNNAGTLTLGNLKLLGSGGHAGQSALSSIGLTSGKWYMEFRTINAGNNYPRIGLSLANAASNGGGGSSNLDFTNQGYQPAFLFEAGSENNGSNCKNGGESAEKTGRAKFGTVSYTNTGTSGGSNIFAFALDLDNRKLFISKDGTYFNSGDPANGTNPQIAWTTTPSEFIHIWADAYQDATQIIANWGQDSTFSGNETAGGNADENGFGDFKYSPPTGFLTMCSANLPISDDIDPAQTDDDYPSKQFGVVTFTGNGSSRTISGLGFQPDLIWGKRTDGSQRHYLVDSNRGFTRYLHSEDTYSEGGPNSTGVTSANSDGFVIGGGLDYINANTHSYVTWCWRANGGTTASNSNGSITATVQANTAAGFSIATYTSPGSGTNHTVGHGLSDVDFIITKDRSSTFNWYCFHKSSPDYTYRLNSGSRFSYSNWSMGSTTWGSEDGYTHNSTDDFVAYCWQNVSGMQHFGSYIGNGNSNGPVIYTGFRPRLIFTLQDNSSSGWRVRDTERDTFNPSDSIVWWNRSDRQYDSTGYNIDIFSNGFKITNGASDFNTSGTTYLYGAWGDVPFKYNNTF